MRIYNVIGEAWYDKETRMGRVAINGKPFPIYHMVVGHDDEKFKDIMAYGVQIALDYNQSNKFYLTSNTLTNLVKKLRRQEHKIVKPALHCY